MKSFAAGLSIALMTLAGCASEKVVDPPINVTEGSGLLAIQTVQTEYSWPSGAGDWLGVDATIRNNSDRTLYANVGDAMNVSMDQELLCVCQGSDGTIEKQVAPSSWPAVQMGPAIEGVKVIAISGGKTYRLTGSMAPRSTGTHRIRLDYANQPEIVPGRKTYRDFSNAFVIR